MSLDDNFLKQSMTMVLGGLLFLASKHKKRASNQFANTHMSWQSYSGPKNGVLDWYSRWPKEFPPPSKVAEEIQRMAQESGMLETSPQKIIREIKDENAVPGSAFEWLIGRKLPEVFEQFFRDDPTVYKKGRYADFAAQVLTEFAITNDGQPHSRDTLIRALTAARSGRSRRRHSGQK
jgi:hypothetical protein